MEVLPFNLILLYAVSLQYVRDYGSPQPPAALTHVCLFITPPTRLSAIRPHEALPHYSISLEFSYEGDIFKALLPHCLS